MGLRITSGGVRALLGLVLLLAVGACERAPQGGGGATAGKRVASLVPAATDMLLAMGAGDRLVAVSNFETSPAVTDLPRVGDYQSTDWEGIARLKPDVMIIQIAADRLPAGMTQRAAELGVELVNVKIYTLEDVFEAMRVVGRAAGVAEKGEAQAAAVRGRLEAIRAACARRPAVRALVFRNGTGRDVVGPGNFLDDLLKIANVTNAADPVGNPWPSIDREKIAALAPEAIVVMLPDNNEGSLDESRRSIRSLGAEVSAVRDGRVYTITDPYALLPGPRVAEVAERIATSVHGGDVLKDIKSR